MKTAQTERMADYINDGLFAVTNPGPLHGPIKNIKLNRSRKGDLILTTTSVGPPREASEKYPAGTVRQSAESVELQHIGGARGIGRGVVPHGQRSRYFIDRETETIEKSSLHSMEIDFNRDNNPDFLIEWVGNVADNGGWPHAVDYQYTETSSETIGPAESQVIINGSAESRSSGTAAMRLVIADVELFLLGGGGKDRESRIGRIIYRSCPSQEIRDKIRNCLSFALGLPIVYYGHTEYCSDWVPTKARSVSASTIGGSVFHLHAQPPFPILDNKHRHFFDARLVATIVNNIFDKYDVLNFQFLSWTYWHAMCAPVHMAAAHFGAVIEQFQRAPLALIKASRRNMLDDKIWKDLRAKMTAVLDGADIPKELIPIFKNKVAGVNQTPQTVVLKRLLESLGLALGDVEITAWKHRNMAAHGHIPEDRIDVILSSKALRVLFHRLLAGVTYCSDAYVDYYNLNYPLRALSDPIPARA